MTGLLPPVLQPDLIDAILGAQAENGAFVSFVALRDRRLEDRNGLITALVLRAIGHGPQPARLREARERALDYLERCERAAEAGSFGFWPETDRPAWAPVLPADADDTAVIALELHRAGRRSLEWLRRLALLTLLRFRVTESDGEPPWVRPGVIRTWLAPGGANPVDLVANVNVAALLAAAGLAHVSAYRAVVSMIAAALHGSRGTIDVSRLAPFYAHPAELHWALAHAVASGASELQPSRDRVAGLCGASAYVPDRPVCCSAYGAVAWSAPVLQEVRRALGALEDDR